VLIVPKLDRTGRSMDGVKFGRKHSYKPAQAEHVKGKAAQGLPHRKVAVMVGLSATTVRRILQEA
jgi:DNA invertase Pin-like site-specific DNA recombinase